MDEHAFRIPPRLAVPEQLQLEHVEARRIVVEFRRNNYICKKGWLCHYRFEKWASWKVAGNIYFLLTKERSNWELK